MIEKADNNRHRCSECYKTIKQDTYYYSIDYKGSFGTSHKNVCVSCMLKGIIKNFGGDIRKIKKVIEETAKKMILEKLEKNGVKKV